jgi:hypothetical protein
MNKNIYLGLIASMSLISASVIAESKQVIDQMLTAVEMPVHLSGPAPALSDHKGYAQFLSKQAVYHKGLAKHETTVAQIFGNNGDSVLKSKHEALAAKELALANDYDATASEHGKMATPAGHMSGPAPSASDHKGYAEFLSKHADYQRELAANNSSVAQIYGTNGNSDLKAKHETLASQEEALAKQYEVTAAEQAKAK